MSVGSVSIPSLESRKEDFHFGCNLVPRALFPGFGGGAPRLQSQGNAPWGRGCFGWWTDFYQEPGFPKQIVDVVRGVSISISSEETTPILAATAVNFCLGLENNLDASFYNWLVYNQTQWTRSVTHHWNMLKPAVKSSWAEYLLGSDGEYGLWPSLDGCG